MTARQSSRILDDGGQPFEVVVLEPTRATAVVLFSVGGGGDPRRHLGFLQSLAAEGCLIAAPAAPRLVAPAPTAAELETRARRLRLAFADIAQPGLPSVGVGHSIGATLLLMLAGARGMTIAGEAVAAGREPGLERLLLMAPSADFFRAPGALDGLRARITIWAAGRDHITPLEHAELLQRRVGSRAPLELRVAPQAGHFSFMNEPPPHAEETLPDRDAFLAELAREVTDAIAGESA